jgi:ATP/maltotriose-dependent transcriptional regulator MalT
LAHQGLVAEAIHHAFAGGEPERVADLVEQAAEALLKRGE